MKSTMASKHSSNRGGKENTFGAMAKRNAGSVVKPSGPNQSSDKGAWTEVVKRNNKPCGKAAEGKNDFTSSNNNRITNQNQAKHISNQPGRGGHCDQNRSPYGRGDKNRSDRGHGSAVNANQGKGPTNQYGKRLSDEHSRFKSDRKDREPTKTILLQGLGRERKKELFHLCLLKDSRLNQRLLEWGISGKVCAESDTLVLLTDDQLRYTERGHLARMFKKHEVIGFDEWLGGAKGWRYEEDETLELKWKTDFVIVLNSLHDVFKLFAPKEQLFMPNSKEMTWKKQQTLKACVSDIRIWLETLSHSSIVNSLLRTSNDGPDAPIHWAHHHPQSTRYPLNVITMGSMKELVNGIVSILRKEFYDKSGVPLGTRWQKKNKHQTTWKKTACFEWNGSVLKSLLNGSEKF